MRRTKAHAHAPTSLDEQIAAASAASAVAAATSSPGVAAAPSVAGTKPNTATVTATPQPFTCDRTREFRNIVEAQRKIGKQIGDTESNASIAAAILPRVSKPTPFTDSARHLMSSIRRMGEFLASQRSEYLDLHRHLSASSSGGSVGSGDGRRSQALTDADRDRLENEVNVFVLGTNQRVDQLKERIRGGSGPLRSEEDLAVEREELADESEEVRAVFEAEVLEEQNADLRAHQHTVIIFLFDALRQLAAAMASLKAQRTAQMRADVEERHPGALAMHAAQQRERRHRAGADGATSTSDASKASAASTTESDAEADTTVSALLGKAVKQSVSKLHRMGATEHDKGGALHVPEDDGPSNAPVLSAAELAMLQEENHHLLDSLEDQLDAMRRAESQMHSIVSLMNLFNSKVLQQEEQIGTIYDNTVNSTLHVHAGISELKKAAARGVTFRMMILFMILVMSFSLLFLDWYSA